MFLLGGYATVSQVCLVREFVVVFFGNELCLGIILASWLAGVAAGASVGARAAQRVTDGMRVMTFCFMGVMALMVVAVCTIRSLRGILQIPTGEYATFAGMALAVAAVTIPVSASVGFVFPIACAATRRGDRQGSTEIGTVYAIESLGSILGGILFTYVLVTRLHVFRTLSVLNIACLAALTVCDAARRREAAGPAAAGRVAALLLVAQIAALLGALDTRLHDATRQVRWKAFNPELPLVRSLESRYEHLAMTEHEGTYSVFGSGQYMFSFPAERISGGLAHVTLCEHPDPKRVLIIGGAMGGFLKHALLHRPKHLDYVELDPAIFDLVRDHIGPDEKLAMRDPRVSIHLEDGRRFAKRVAGTRQYDVVVVNVPDPSTAMLNRFYTVDFFRELRRILAEDGVVAAHITSAVNYMGEEVGNYAGSVYATLCRVFPEVVVTPGDTKLFFASPSKGVVTSDMQELGSRYEARGVDTEYFSPYHFGQYFETPERSASVRAEFERLRDSPVNTDLRPVSYFHNLMLWDRFSGGHLGPVLKAVAGIRVVWVAACALALLALRAVYVAALRPGREKCRRFNALAAVMTTGFAAMALELALLLAYQSFCGFVYERIGLVLAVFMTGLAAGALLVNSLLRQRSWNWIACLAVAECLVMALAAAIPVALRALSRGGSPDVTEWAIAALVLCTGLLTGGEFPLANRVYLEGLQDVGRAAGMTDSVDHLGGFLGALMAGIFLIPVLGIEAACLIVGVLNAATMVLVLSGARGMKVPDPCGGRRA